MPNRDLGEKFRAFGFEVIEIDGHNMEEICATLENAMHQRMASRNAFMHIPSKVKAYPSWRILYHGME